MKFNNRENERVQVEDRVIWVSRSSAVIGHVFCAVGEGSDRKVSVLMTQRGKSCPNEVGKWCLPCGYLDWDENGADAVIREVWEETGINLNNIINNAEKIVYNGLKTCVPWFVLTDPKADEFQNICLHYGVAVKSKTLPLIGTPESLTNGEVSDINWVPIEDVENLNTAFNHGQRVMEFSKFLLERRFKED